MEGALGRGPGAGTRAIPLVSSALFAALLLGVLLGVMRASRPPLASLTVPPADAPATRVILIAIDGLRQDHASVYGYPRPTTPHLEALARRATVFTNAYAHAPAALASHVSLATGVNPRTHGVQYPNDALPESFVTIAEVLANAGYRTAGFTDGGFLDREHGLAQGFQTFEDRPAPGGPANNGFRRRAGQLREWLHRRGAERSFLFFDAFDLHGPYVAEEEDRAALASTQPIVPADADRLGDPMDLLRGLRTHEYLQPDAVEDVAGLVDDYDAALRFVDREIGRLVEFLDGRGLFDGTCLVVTSGHGEAFFDRGFYAGHGLTLYDEEVRVPLIVKFPRGRFAGERCDAVVRLVDLFPTICAAAGVAVPEIVEGADLALAVAGLDPEPRAVFGCGPFGAAPGVEGPDGFMAFVRRGDVKFVDAPKMSFEDLVTRHLHRTEPGEPGYDLARDPLDLRRRTAPFREPQVYDLAADPGERVNVAADRPDVVASAREWIARIEEAAVETRRIHRDASVGEPRTIEEIRRREEQIRAQLELGYLSTSEYQVSVARLRMLEQRIELDERARAEKGEARTESGSDG